MGIPFTSCCVAATPLRGIPNNFGVIYVGADGKQGTEDDIKSWEKPPKD